MLLHILILYVRPLSILFSVTPLSWAEWIVVLYLSFPVIIIDEILKFFSRNTSGARFKFRVRRADILQRQNYIINDKWNMYQIWRDISGWPTDLQFVVKHHSVMFLSSAFICIVPRNYPRCFQYNRTDYSSLLHVSLFCFHLHCAEELPKMFPIQLHRLFQFAVDSAALKLPILKLGNWLKMAVSNQLDG
ncbi:hypothetical protein TEA_015902 [Camellia sinensis var. sinensis]|uniref:Cation-transporting P-type ATPase C-terminal domain-containing protein n=1 Tax=Camellia sinensis var. sinensis TaxID=542762 RepID=A0A4S4D4T0_CAMSN|nr:hypothetical protein TEA_015902 [Camellia sinensis var. sinensis]